MADSPAVKARFHLVTALTVAALCLIGCEKNISKTSLDPENTGRTVVFDSMSKSVNPSTLETLRWQDIAPTAEACSRHGLTEETLKVSETLDSAPVIYLRGLLKLALQDNTGAAAEWQRLQVADIPPDHLYPPWRLADSSATPENRYRAPLSQAVAENRAGPLVRARFLSSTGQWRAGLDAYLLTDPATWSPFEVRIFSGMKLQAPCSRDVAVLMAGALAGGRVPNPLRTDIAKLIKGTPVTHKESLAASLRANPALAKAATTAAAKALTLRQAFASNQFEKVVAHAHDADPLEATDEAVWLIFLAASHLKDAPTADRWATELLRRNPTETTRKWITEIRADAS